MKPKYWNAAIAHLKQKDHIMEQIIDKHGSTNLLERKNTAFSVLVSSIISQQVSTAAAQTITKRLSDLLCKNITEENILKTKEEDILSCGISKQKLSYILNVARYTQTKPESYYDETDYKVLEKELLLIKGIGSWTFKMFSIFFLMQGDEFPESDIGIMRSISKNYSIELKDKDFAQKMCQLSLIWSPYRTVASMYLWRDLDGGPINY